MRWLKNCDKGEPRELAGEPYTAAVGFFSFPIFHREAKKDKRAAVTMTRERKFCDSLVSLRTTRRADGACFYLKEFTRLKTSAGRAGAKLADRGRGTPLYRACAVGLFKFLS